MTPQLGRREQGKSSKEETDLLKVYLSAYRVLCQQFTNQATDESSTTKNPPVDDDEMGLANF